MSQSSPSAEAGEEATQYRREVRVLESLFEIATRSPATAHLGFRLADQVRILRECLDAEVPSRRDDFLWTLSRSPAGADATPDDPEAVRIAPWSLRFLVRDVRSDLLEAAYSRRMAERYSISVFCTSSLFLLANLALVIYDLLRFSDEPEMLERGASPR